MVLFVVFAFILSANLLGGPQVSKDQHTATDATARRAENDKRPIPPTHVIIDPPLPAVSSKPESNDSQNEPAEKPLPRFIRPEWIIVYITAIYVFITWLMWRTIKRQSELLKQQVDDTRTASIETTKIASGTLKAIETQSRSMERQIQLQEATMMQWVSVQKWRASWIETIGTLPVKPRLQIDFEIANQSSFPLTMDADFSFFWKSPGAVSYHARDIVLLPRKPYNVMFGLPISDIQASQYESGILRISVYGRIVHIGVTNQQSPLMRIDADLICGASIPARLEHETIVMVPQDDPSEEV